MDWTTWLQFTLSGVGAVTSIGIFLGGLGYYRDGKNKSQLDEANKKINANTLLQQDVAELTKTVEKQQLQINELKATVENLYKLNKEYVEIFRGQNPAMKTFIEVMTKYIDANTPLLEKIKTEVIPTIEHLQKFLDKESF